MEQRSQFKNLVVAQGGVESLGKFLGERGGKEKGSGGGVLPGLVQDMVSGGGGCWTGGDKL